MDKLLETKNDLIERVRTLEEVVRAGALWEKQLQVCTFVHAVRSFSLSYPFTPVLVAKLLLNAATATSP